MKHSSVIITLLTAVLLLTACRQQHRQQLTSVVGKPYEVTVVCSDPLAAALMDSVLSLAVEGLPQEEPAFDVVRVNKDTPDAATRLTRNIVWVTVDDAHGKTTGIRYARNVWTTGQTVVYVNAPSVTSLSKAMVKHGGRMRDVLNRAEMKMALTAMGKGSNAKAEKAIDSMMQCRIKVPKDMIAMKRGRQFVWCSDNAAKGMKSLCIYTCPGLSMDEASFCRVRDSVMRENMPGECQGMYMQTVRQGVTARTVKAHGRTIMICRGLWEMRGDAMGGPFVAHVLADSARQRLVVAEAFVYAPEMKKRNLMKQAEALLYTLRCR